MLSRCVSRGWKGHKRRDASKGQGGRSRWKAGGENLHTMATDGAQQWANLQPLYHLSQVVGWKGILRT